MFEIGFKFLKFCIVGSLGLSIDFGATYLLKEKIKINKYVSNSIGFILATFSNYLFNKYWTFKDTDPDALMQFTKFVSVSFVGLGFSNMIIYLLINKKGVKFLLDYNEVMKWLYTINLHLMKCSRISLNKFSTPIY